MPPQNPQSPPPSSSRPPVQVSSLEQALELLQSRMDHLQQQLAEQNKLATLGMVAAVLAHEFNNILTPMISYTTVALSDKADEALRKKAIEKALAGAQRLSNISQSLLGFARGGTASDGPNIANIKHAVSETLSCLARDLAKDAIVLTLEIPHDLHVPMNPGQLQQVLLNLIVNARAAMLTHGAGGGKRLTISAKSLEQKKTQIVVADTGPGIPPEILDRIFDPFFSTKTPQGTSPQKAEAVPRGGTGLGLTICHQLVTSAGGTITATNTQPRGATFTMEFSQ